MERDNKQFIIERFKEVEALGFVKSRRSNNTGIGKTFEDYVGVVENNLEEPDLAGFEIKSHRTESSNYVTLFTKSPTFPKGANKYLRDNFGTTYKENTELKKLHTSMFATKFNSYNGRYSFKLKNDKQEKKLIIGVYDLDTHRLIDDSVGYSYDSIKKVLEKKLKQLFYVSAKRRYDDNRVEEFHFNHAEIYTNPSLEKFLDLIDNGLIMYDIRIGSYRSGKNYGKPHDHGSGFRILEGNIHLLYEQKENVE